MARRHNVLFPLTFRSSLRASLGSGMYFFILEMLRTNLKQSPSLDSRLLDKRGKDFFSGMLAKTIAVFAVNPITTIKTQFESSRKKISFKEAIQKINSSSSKSYYSGFWATFYRDVPYSAIQFTIYNSLYDLFHLNKEDNFFAAVAAIGGISSVLALALSHPFDVLRVTNS